MGKPLQKSSQLQEKSIPLALLWYCQEEIPTEIIPPTIKVIAVLYFFRVSNVDMIYYSKRTIF